MHRAATRFLLSAPLEVELLPAAVAERVKMVSERMTLLTAAALVREYVFTAIELFPINIKKITSKQ